MSLQESKTSTGVRNSNCDRMKRFQKKVSKVLSENSGFSSNEEDSVYKCKKDINSRRSSLNNKEKFINSDENLNRSSSIQSLKFSKNSSKSSLKESHTQQLYNDNSPFNSNHSLLETNKKNESFNSLPPTSAASSNLNSNYKTIFNNCLQSTDMMEDNEIPSSKANRRRSLKRQESYSSMHSIGVKRNSNGNINENKIFSNERILGNQLSVIDKKNTSKSNLNVKKNKTKNKKDPSSPFNINSMSDDFPIRKSSASSCMENLDSSNDINSNHDENDRSFTKNYQKRFHDHQNESLQSFERKNSERSFSSGINQRETFENQICESLQSYDDNLRKKNKKSKNNTSRSRDRSVSRGRSIPRSLPQTSTFDNKFTPRSVSQSCNLSETCKSEKKIRSNSLTNLPVSHNKSSFSKPPLPFNNPEKYDDNNITIPESSSYSQTSINEKPGVISNQNRINRVRNKSRDSESLNKRSDRGRSVSRSRINKSANSNNKLEVTDEEFKLEMIKKKLKNKKIVKNYENSGMEITKKSELKNSNFDDSAKKNKREEKIKLEKKRRKDVKKNKKVVLSEFKEDEESALEESVENTVDVLFKHVKKKVSDFFDNVVAIKIHSAESLKPNIKVLKPVVMVHIVDARTGTYLKKSDNKRPVTTFHETENLTYILPIITKPFSFPKNMTLTPKWEEELVFNDEYLHVVKEDVLIFFEILDFLTTNPKKVSNEVDGWYRVAWAFLQVVGKNQQSNTEVKARLQLYKYPKKVKLLPEYEIPTPYVYKCFKELKKPYPSTLYVTIKGIPLLQERVMSLRPFFPTDVETGKYTYEHLMDEYLKRKQLTEPMMKNLFNISKTRKWRRLAGQRCKLPNKLLFRIDPGTKGAQCLSFSNNGLFLAVGCVTSPNSTSGKNSGYNTQNAAYPIKIYSVLTGDRVACLEGHQDLVYEVNWSLDDDNLASCSSDGSARIWSFLSDGSVRASVIFQHPTYVYTCGFNSTTKSPRILVTGSFDGEIRIWGYDPYGKYPEKIMDEKPLNILTGHKGGVNTLCFDNEGNKLFSGDTLGVIRIWSPQAGNSTAYDNTFEFVADFKCIKTITSFNGVPITSLKMHPTNRKILVQLQNNTLQTLDIRIFRFLTRYEGKNAVSSKEENFNFTYNSLESMTMINKIQTEYHTDHNQKDDLSDLPLIRACISPCGYQVWSGFASQAMVWKTDTGDLQTIYEKDSCTEGEDCGLGISKQIVGVSYHPHDHIVAFCAFGDSQPVVLFTYDENYKEKDILCTEPVHEKEPSESLELVNARPSKVIEQKLEKRRLELNSITDLLANSTRDLSQSIGKYPIDISVDGESYYTQENSSSSNLNTPSDNLSIKSNSTLNNNYNDTNKLSKKTSKSKKNIDGSNGFVENRSLLSEPFDSTITSKTESIGENGSRGYDKDQFSNPSGSSSQKGSVMRSRGTSYTSREFNSQPRISGFGGYGKEANIE
ncbi:Jouberin [Lobulomyces angularis]|nr:Jouberin [Lobulomyces angularis]